MKLYRINLIILLGIILTLPTQTHASYTSVRNGFDWYNVEKLDEKTGYDAIVDLQSNMKLSVNKYGEMHIWSDDLQTPVKIDSRSKTILQKYVSESYPSKIIFDSPTEFIGDMSDSFSKMYSVTSIDLQNVTTSQMTNIDRMFEDSSLKSIDLSKFDLKNVQSAKDVFAYSALEDITYPEKNSDFLQN